MTSYSKRTGPDLILERSSTQLHFDTGIHQTTIACGFGDDYSSLLDQLEARGDIKILTRGSHRTNTGGRYKILRPLGPTHEEVPACTDRLLELIRSFVKEGVISSEVSAMQGLAMLDPVDPEHPYERPGDYKEIARIRGLTVGGVRNALRKALRKLGKRRFDRKDGVGGHYPKASVFVFKGVDKLKPDPSRMSATVRGTERLDRFYEIVMSFPIEKDGARHVYNWQLRDRSGERDDQVGRYLRRLHDLKRIVLVPAEQDPETKLWGPIKIFEPTGSRLSVRRPQGRPRGLSEKDWPKVRKLAERYSGDEKGINKRFADALDFENIRRKDGRKWGEAFVVDKKARDQVRQLKKRALRA
jgi:hypothetical protein